VISAVRKKNCGLKGEKEEGKSEKNERQKEVRVKTKRIKYKIICCQIKIKNFSTKYFGSGNEIPIFFYSSFKENKRKTNNTTRPNKITLTYSY
jgi:hypothetical protein